MAHVVARPNSQAQTQQHGAGRWGQSIVARRRPSTFWRPAYVPIFCARVRSLSGRTDGRSGCAGHCTAYPAGRGAEALISPSPRYWAWPPSSVARVVENLYCLPTRGSRMSASRFLSALPAASKPCLASAMAERIVSNAMTVSTAYKARPQRSKILNRPVFPLPFCSQIVCSTTSLERDEVSPTELVIQSGSWCLGQRVSAAQPQQLVSGQRSIVPPQAVPHR